MTTAYKWQEKILPRYLWLYFHRCFPLPDKTEHRRRRYGMGRDERNVHGRSKQANPFYFFFSQSPHLQRQRPEMVRGSELGAILSTSSMARETAILTMMVKRVEKVKKEKDDSSSLSNLACHRHRPNGNAVGCKRRSSVSLTLLETWTIFRIKSESFLIFWIPRWPKASEGARGLL